MSDEERHPRPARGHRLSVGVVGCGRIARLAHLPVLRAHPDVHIAALADADAARLAAAGRDAPGAEPLRDPDALLARDDIDAVVIAVPTAFHAAMAAAAFARGKHVYLEKPLATTVADGRRVVDAWRASGRVGMMGFNYRFDPLLERARRLLHAGAVGELVAVRSVFSTATIDAPDWRHHRASGGGALLDLASHHVDLVRHLTAREVERVSAEIASRRTDDDTGVLQLALGGGVLAQLFVAIGSVEEDRIELFGARGRIVVDRYRSLHVEAEDVGAVRSPLARLRSAARTLAHLPYALEKRRAAGGSPSFARALGAFVAAAGGERSARGERGARGGLPDMCDGLASLAVIEAATVSAQTRRSVCVASAPEGGPVATAAPAAAAGAAASDVAPDGAAARDARDASDAPDAPDAPALTVVFMTPDDYETIRRTMRHVRAQTARNRLEILLLVPSRATLGADDAELAAFRWVRIIETGPVRADGAIRALAVREARAPVVVFTEDHCFPDPEWAAALIAAHAGAWAAVGPVVRNANPETLVSWADLLIGYGPWLAPGEARTMSFLPGHNSSYKVAPLRAYGAELDTLMDAETVLQWDLHRRGEKLFLDPAAQVAHTNFAYWSLWVPIQLHHGRVFADTRGRQWSVARRFAFAAASPLIPFVRLQRVLRDARRSGVPAGLLARVFPTLLAGLAIDGLGQMLGYAIGAGRARERIVEYHYHRNERRGRDRP